MSSSEWSIRKLGDICTKIGSGATPRGGKETYLEDGPVSLIRSQNVLDFSFSYDGLARISHEQAAQLSNVEVEQNDVLLNITGDSVARVCQVPDSILPARVNQHVAIIRSDKSELDAQFIKYYLLNSRFKRYMLALASVGATRKALTKGMIEDFDIALPPLPTQRRIADILSALDDKIELNRQTNATLEAMAQAIFKQWFVDFHYPGATGERVESELGLIPAGWRVGTFGELMILQRGFDLPKKKRVSGKYSVIAASGPSGTHNEFKVKGPGVTTGRSGVLGNVFYSADDFWPLNTSLWVKEFKQSTPIFAFYFLKTLDLSAMNGGSAVPTLNRNHVHALTVAIPPKHLIEEFESIISSLLAIRKTKRNESRTLAQTRDALLPKLMRGEIEV